jgi:hypothetical protein
MPAGLCLWKENNHEIYFTMTELYVNDRNQVIKVLIVLDDLSDKTYNDVKSGFELTWAIPRKFACL